MTDLRPGNLGTIDQEGEDTWEMLYQLLRAIAQSLVRRAGVASWRGQESELVEDIVQETCRRVLEYMRKVACGDAPPIQSLSRFAFVMATNYCRDLRRHDRRLLRLQQPDTFSQVLDQIDEEAQEEAAVENVYNETLFMLIAQEVASFPPKQRRAILIDIAERMHFGRRLTILQQAFLNQNIDLREYRQVAPFGCQEKRRHTALVSYAYKRLTGVQSVKRYSATMELGANMTTY